MKSPLLVGDSNALVGTTVILPPVISFIVAVLWPVCLLVYLFGSWLFLSRRTFLS